MENSKQKIWQGVVKRKSGTMTISVEVQREWQRRPYDKKIKRNKKFLVHDPEELAKVGSEVRFKECRPISKRKRWIIVRDK
jgi:small subunit ribosomal protein S17